MADQLASEPVHNAGGEPVFTADGETAYSADAKNSLIDFAHSADEEGAYSAGEEPTLMDSVHSAEEGIRRRNAPFLPSTDAQELIDRFRIDSHPFQKQPHCAPLTQRTAHSFTSRFVNFCMKTSDGREVMEWMMVKALMALQKKTNQDPEEVFREAVQLLAPTIECASYRSGAKVSDFYLYLSIYNHGCIYLKVLY
jgi:hypothetical protein